MSCNNFAADLCVTRGDSGQLDLTVKAADGTAYDLTGATLFLTVKAALADADSAATVRKEVTVHDDATAGQSHFDLVPADSPTAGKLYYDVQLKTATGEIYTLFGGRWTVLADVTTRTAPL